MAWCRQATSHYVSQCWPWSLSSYDVTRPQWVKMSFWDSCETIISLWWECLWLDRHPLVLVFLSGLISMTFMIIKLIKWGIVYTQYKSISISSQIISTCLEVYLISIGINILLSVEANLIILWASFERLDVRSDYSQANVLTLRLLFVRNTQVDVTLDEAGEILYHDFRAFLGPVLFTVCCFVIW